MKHYLPILLAVITGGLLTANSLGQSNDQDLYAGEGSCLSVVESFGLPLELETEHGVLTPGSSEQVDRTFILLRQALQGKACALRFSEIFKASESSPYFPLTNYLMALAPELTFRDLPLHSRDGRLMGRIVKRVSIDDETGLDRAEIVLPFYYFNYRTDQGEVTTSGNRLLLADYLLDWRDVENRWALDTYSDGQSLLLVGRSYR
jgi:hypothetical protein